MVGYWALFAEPATVVSTRTVSVVGEASADTASSVFFDRAWRAAVVATQSRVGLDEASDIASLVTARLWRHRDRYPELAQSAGALERFATAAARRILLNRERDRRLRSTREQQYSVERTDATTSDDASSRVLTDEMREVVDRVIEALPPRTRQAWRLVHRECMTHKAAAQAMGISTQTVNVQLCRALGALRLAFDHYHRDGALPAARPQSPPHIRRTPSTEQS
jgi:RNA polymerase sigma factor (sigma-70 family)